MMEKAKIGDQIQVKNIVVTISEIISQAYYERDGGWYIEFLDAHGKYGYWKQQFDGGQLIRK